MAKGKAANGRVTFLKNPWPDGHAFATVAFDARLELTDGKPGIYLHFDLQTVEYSDESEGNDAGEDAKDWDSTGVWGNYHRCSLSSTKWGHRGVLAGTRKKPFDLDALDGATLTADPRPADVELDERAFGIYLLGHDGVAKHRLTFRRNKALWDVDWTARIALEYAGQRDYKHRMKAQLTNVPFAGIAVDKTLSPTAATAALAEFVVDAKRWKLEQDRFVPVE